MNIGKVLSLNNRLNKIQNCLKLHTKHENDRRVVITGLGAVSPVGNNVSTAWNTIKNGGCGIIKLGDDYNKIPCQIGGIVDKSTLKYDDISKRDLKSMSVASQYALIASSEAIYDAQIDLDLIKESTGVSIGSSMMDITDIIQTYEDFKKGYKYVTPFFVPRILVNMPAGHISIKYGLRGPNHTVSTACATGAHAIGDGYRFIKNGNATAMICGATDSCISPFTIAAFCRMKALATKYNDNPDKGSRPFDKERDGFVMAEGAAILILEDLEHAMKRNAKIYAEIKGYGLSGDGTHITAPREDASGAIMAMKRALNEARLSLEDVTYINAHATSTPLGDAIEARAIKSLFQSYSSKILISSTKGAHGHLLGAAGSLESIFTIKAIEEGILPPNINFNSQNNEFDLNIVSDTNTKYTNSRKIAVKNSFGFGGTNASLCFSSLE
ncbi:3-oxoacyl-[acyl-carrier-protein] synthase, mitochondrial [Chrysoperla carnea]|uniref:3-oxoacyl-[acyl-carrier-protein] synthase, mitochondrial n=1 Tax=Chrysoperla carnea TaxID=189513 RepID=UPI001D062D49|nr:3-oxoacyl-[acyl-carrier-protein] synthase, mitochondrial [Chrysoperla carnea]XP_044734527.1 3-oxoacyl-[acyl-carrier-protein] synthase, mitochondrial [Chrysoperla carnea]